MSWGPCDIKKEFIDVAELLKTKAALGLPVAPDAFIKSLCFKISKIKSFFSAMATDS